MKKEYCSFDGMKYIISYPNNYDANKKYPVIFFLHGAGSRGDNLQLLEGNPYFVITEKNAEFPFITIAPLCYKNTWYDVFEKLQNFVFYCRKLKFVDADKFYLMGGQFFK